MSAAIDVAHLRPATDPVARARALAPLIAAAAPRIEAARCLPPDLLEALHGAGLFRTLLPRAFGGEETDPVTFFRMMEVIAGADASVGWCVGQASGCSMAAAYLDPATAREIYADPRAVIAWGMGNGVAQVVEGGFQVEGAWRFASGSRHATWVGAHCKVRERDGSMRRDAGGELIERTMLFRRDDLAWTDDWQVVGLRGTGSDSYAVRDAFVPDARSVTRDTDAERRQLGTLYRLSTLHLYATAFAGVSLGIARTMLDDFKAMAMAKTPAATTRGVRDSEVIQSGTAMAEAKLRSARAFVIEALETAWSRAQRGPLEMAERIDIRLATTSAIHRAKEVAEWAYHEAGATAIFENRPFERRMRDIHAAGQQVQGRTDHLETCGRWFLGFDAGLRFV